MQLPRFRKPTSKEKLHGRDIARRHYIDSKGDEAKFREGVKAEVQESYGSIILMVTLAAAILQICYTLYKFWKDTKTTIPPMEPVAGVEPVDYN